MAGNISQSINLISHPLLFLALLIGQTRQVTTATAGYHPENSFLICVKAHWLRCAQGAPLCSQVPAEPLISLRVCLEFIPCTSVEFRDLGKSHACSINNKIKPSCSTVTPLPDDTPEDTERKPALNRNFRLWARTPASDTKAALPLSAGLFPHLFCLFVSRHRAHSLDATRFPLNLIQLFEKNPQNLLVEIMMLPSKEGLKVGYWTNFFLDAFPLPASE